MSGLHVQAYGQGEPLVLIHGWGMHSGVWHGLVEQLAARWQVMCVDLPGHGRSSTDCPLELEVVVEQLLQQVPQPAHYLGWSLGASVVQQLAICYPEQVRSMFLIAATPCFAQRDDWVHGIEQSVLQGFATQLQQDHRKTLQKFIALQTLGSEDAKQTLQQLQSQLFSVAEPDPQALKQGLDILSNVDLRSGMNANSHALYVLLGAKDRVVPASVADYYRQLGGQVQIIEQAGHAPFISHPLQTLAAIETFLQAA